MSYLQKTSGPVRKPVKTQEIKQPEKKAEVNIKLNPADYHADVPFASTPSAPVSNSQGFDPKKLRELSKTRLINEFVRKQAYEKTYNSVGELLNCVRQNYYYRLKYQVDVNKNFNFEYLQLYADVGTSIHEFTQKTYDFAEVKKGLISENYRVKGEADAVTIPFLYEIKSIDTKKFNGSYRVNDYHQGNIYAYILNTEYKYRLSTVTLVYFFRDALSRDPFAIDIPVDNRLAISFLERSLLLNESLEKKKLPDKIGSSEEKCKYCMFKNYCESDSKNVEKEKVILKSTFSM